MNKRITPSVLTHVQIILVWIVEHFDKLDDVRMIEFLQDRNFTIDALERMLYSRLAAVASRQLLCTATEYRTSAKTKVKCL